MQKIIFVKPYEFWKYAKSSEECKEVLFQRAPAS